MRRKFENRLLYDTSGFIWLEGLFDWFSSANKRVQAIEEVLVILDARIHRGEQVLSRPDLPLQQRQEHTRNLGGLKINKQNVEQLRGDEGQAKDTMGDTESDKHNAEKSRKINNNPGTTLPTEIEDALARCFSCDPYYLQSVIEN
jgi:septation ring formation regulator EzrA